MELKLSNNMEQACIANYEYGYSARSTRKSVQPHIKADIFIASKFPCL